MKADLDLPESSYTFINHILAVYLFLYSARKKDVNNEKQRMTPNYKLLT